MPIPKSKEQLEDLRTYLLELEAHQGYLAVQRKLQDLLSLDQRNLEKAPSSEVAFLQGSIKRLRSALKAKDDLIREIRNMEKKDNDHTSD